MMTMVSASKSWGGDVKWKGYSARLNCLGDGSLITSEDTELSTALFFIPTDMS